MPVSARGRAVAPSPEEVEESSTFFWRVTGHRGKKGLRACIRVGGSGSRRCVLLRCCFQGGGGALPFGSERAGFREHGCGQPTAVAGGSVFLRCGPLASAILTALVRATVLSHVLV